MLATEAQTTPGGVGRIKAPPVCLDSSLKETSTPLSELLQATFPPLPQVDTTAVITTEAVPVSSSSSTCTRESDASAYSDAEAPIMSSKSVLNRTTNRQGRATQRWVNDAETNEPIRLVTGCVPIMRGGKILFVSASRKAEWILPKGGWEQDEKMEESALRETFEEAGVLGTLGPKLSMIQYETRKAKKRRLELEEMERQKRAKPTTTSTEETPEEPPKSPTEETPLKEAVALLSPEAITRITQTAVPPRCDETVSVASSSAGYSQVRMTLFPLFVTNVAETWPESGRFRRAVDIDEAIKMTAGRPEFHAVLKEVKNRGLHLVTEPHHHQ